MKTLNLVKMAMYLALFTVLDVLASQLPVFQMPNGGSLGLGTVVLLLAAYDLGWIQGLMVALLSVLMQMLFTKVYFLRLDQIFFDYFLAFGIYGLAPLLGIFPRKADGKASLLNILIGTFMANLIRLLSHAWVGVFFWLPQEGEDLPVLWAASLSYQAGYMIPTLIYGVILLPILYEALWPLIKRQTFSKPDSGKK